ncbi:hypothetical protein, partial [Nocardioides sp. Root151]|uniref:hypothetical protein n=1 Tax=Nocardioides sp. Root151 TaxID=1736475 RepID=UPI000A65335A
MTGTLPARPAPVRQHREWLRRRVLVAALAVALASGSAGVFAGPAAGAPLHRASIVNAGPVATDDAVTGDEDVPTTGNVLTNDTDP